MLFSFLQAYNLSFISSLQIISSLFSLVIIGSGIYYIWTLYLLISKKSIDDKEYMKRFNGVYRMYKDQDSAIFECFTLAKKMLFSFLLVFLNG